VRPLPIAGAGKDAGRGLPVVKADIAALDWKYRARRTGQTPAEYASAIEGYRKPRRNWPAVIFSAALVVATLLIWSN
jgi:hypothetical protein